jgi:hypothetical protein
LKASGLGQTCSPEERVRFTERVWIEVGQLRILESLPKYAPQPFYFVIFGVSPVAPGSIYKRAEFVWDFDGRRHTLYRSAGPTPQTRFALGGGY